MCRIAGTINPTVPIAQLQLQVKQMCDLQRHGGPDDEGQYTDETAHLVLGNRRLSLLDLTFAGHMPMRFLDRYEITYNGELYNYRELKQQLAQLGYHFTSHTDTEVLLAAFAEWNTQSFMKLQGMFAFAIWDEHTKGLFLVRDAAGIKPLYYSTANDQLIFASEVRAFKYPNQPLMEDPRWPVLHMAYGHLPEPVTTYSSVLSLPKGCYLHYETRSGRHSLQSFKHYSFSVVPEQFQNVKEAVHASLEKAVICHLVADAPIGVFLSGGLDSGIISMLAAKKKDLLLHTLSIYFAETSYSEKPYQELMVQQLKSKHRYFLLGKENFLHDLPTILQAYDLPSCDGMNTWFISKYAAGMNLKAVLSGIGGDELFGGYPSFALMRKAIALQHLPAFAKSVWAQSPDKRLARLSFLTLEGIKGIYLFLRGHFTPTEIAAHLQMDEQEVWRILEDTSVFTNVHQLAPLNMASWMELNMYMQNQLLRDADVMSMQHGVEIRIPFLDDKLLQLAHQLAPHYKRPKPYSKQLLVDCFRHELPNGIHERPKMGFKFPFDEWLKESSLVKDVMASSGKVARNTFDSFLQGREPWYKLMALLQQQFRQSA